MHVFFLFIFLNYYYIKKNLNFLQKLGGIIKNLNFLIEYIIIVSKNNYFFYRLILYKFLIKNNFKEIKNS